MNYLTKTTGKTPFFQQEKHPFSKINIKNQKLQMSFCAFCG